MEITEISMISDFEAGMKCLQNPSSVSRFILRTSLLKWGALFFAIFATLSSLIKRIKLLLIRLNTVKPFSPQYQQQLIDYSDYDEDDDDVSLASSDDEDDLEEEEEEEEETEDNKDEDFSVKGSRFCFRNQWRSGDLRRSVSGVWSEFTSGKNVVKLWDSLGLSLDFDEDLINSDYSSGVVSMWDSDQNRKMTDFNGGVWSMAAPAVVLTAGVNGKGDGVVLGGYDSRMRRRVPVLYGEWRSPAAEVDGVAVAGGGKVYVRNEVNGVVTVGDVRNMRMPLENVRDVNGAVILGEEFDESS